MCYQFPEDPSQYDLSREKLFVLFSVNVDDVFRFVVLSSNPEGELKRFIDSFSMHYFAFQRQFRRFLDSRWRIQAQERGVTRRQGYRTC